MFSALQDSLHFLQIIDGLELVHDSLHFLAVVNTEFDGSVEDTVVAADGELVDVDAQLVADNLAPVSYTHLTLPTNTSV